MHGNAIAQPTEVANLAELALISTHADWAPGIFRENHRNMANFINCYTVGLDVDKGPTLEEARTIFKDYAHAIMTTRNHQKEKAGLVADRYRVVLLLDSPILLASDYKALYTDLCIKWPFLDPACSDASRMFFKSVAVAGVQQEGLRLSSSVKGKLANATKAFLEQGAPPGQFNSTLFKAAKDLQQQGYNKEQALEILRKPTGHLDNTDLKTINSAYANPAKYEPREFVEPSKLSAREWLSLWLKEHNVTVDYRDRMTFKNRRITLDELLVFFRVDSAEFKIKASTQQLNDAVYMWIAESKLLIRENYRQKLSYMPGRDRFIELSRILEGKENELTAAVFRHWVWQIKRKLNGLTVVHHLMPVLCGASGGGKSKFVARLIAPLEEITTIADFEVVSDSRQKHVMGKYPVIFFDEMGYAAKTDVDALKHVISADEITYRPLNTNGWVSLYNISTFIGASNKEVIDLIKDPTSARRYYQVDCQDRLPWDEVNAFPMVELWNHIDENGPPPIEPYLEKLTEVQADIKAPTTVEEWFKQRAVLDESARTTPTMAYEDYADWCQLQRYRNQASITQFGKELAHLCERDRDAKGRFYRMRLLNSFVETNYTNI